MTDAMPALGAERNVKLAELLGWKNAHVSCGAWYGHAPGSVFVTAIPDFCRDDAACFGLLITLLDHIEIKDLAMGRYGQRVLVTVVLNRPEQVNGLSDFPETNAGWRDAITQAAWKALTAAKESK